MYRDASAEFYTVNSTIDVQKHRLRGTIGNTPFTSDDIVSGSFSYSAACADASSFQVGGVRIGVINCSFLNNLSIGPRSWRGKEIVVEFGLCISEHPDVYEYIPLCRGVISEATISAGIVVIKAYDNMSKFDTDLEAGATITGTAFAILSEICDKCGVTLGNTRLEIESMPNGSAPILSPYAPNDCKTYRDWLYWLSQTLAGFATIGRDGKLYIKSYVDMRTLDTILTDDDRLKGATISDYVTQYAAVTFTNISDGTTNYYGSGTPVYHCGANPFLQYGTKSERDNMRTETADAVRGCHYMPFSLKIKNAPIYDLGDVVMLTGGIVDIGRQHIGVVQSITYTAGKTLLLQGFGRDPMQKPIENRATTGNTAKAESNTLSYYDYKSNEETVIPESAHNEWTAADASQIVRITFVAQTQTLIEVINEIDSYFYNLNDIYNNPCYVSIAYFVYVDGILQNKRPAILRDTPTADLFAGDFSGHDGYRKDVFDFYGEVTTPGTHTYEVKAVCKQPHGAGVSIISPAGGIFALLKGQGLVKVEVWDGFLLCSDNMPELVPLVVEFLQHSFDTLEVTRQTPIPLAPSENVPLVPLALGAAYPMVDGYLTISFEYTGERFFGDSEFCDNQFIY